MIDLNALQSMEKKTLLKFLKIRHAWWRDNKDDWSVYGDFRRGEIVPESYLLQGSIEPDADFSVRCKMSVFAPETPRIVDHVMGFLRRNDSNREKLSPELTEFSEKADRNVSRIGQVVLSALEESLYYSACFILIDRVSMPIDPDTGQPRLPKSRLENEQYGLPYCVLYQPHQIVNWEYGDNGTFNWIVIREETCHQATPFSSKDTWVVYRIFDRESYAVITLKPIHRNENQQEFRADEDKENDLTIEITGGEHHLGLTPIVPVVPFAYSPDAYAQGISFVSHAVKRDIVVFRLESDQLWNFYLHMHPQLVIKSSDIKAIVSFKANSAIRLDPSADEDAKYIGPPSDIFIQSREMIRENRDECWIATGQEASSRISKDRIKEQSGVHKRLSFEMAEGTILMHLSDKIVEIEKAIFEIVSRYMNASENPDSDTMVFAGEISRKKSYDLFWIGDLLAQIKESQDILRHSPTLMEKLIQRIAQAMLDSPSQEVLDQILKEIANSKPFISDHATTLIEYLEALKNDPPSQEMIKQLYRKIAEMLFPGDENIDVLNTIIEEIEESEIGTQNEFDRQITTEITGMAG